LTTAISFRRVLLPRRDEILAAPRKRSRAGGLHRTAAPDAETDVGNQREEALMRSHRRVTTLVGFVALLTAACSSGASTSPSATASTPPASTAASTQPSSGAVTIDWWHIAISDPGKKDFQKFADDYVAAHPNVKINITVLENEAFKAKLTTTMQSGDVPDIFHSWGGGVMAAQADAGRLKDVTADIASWKDTINPGAMSIYQYNGKQYGLPWDVGIIGFWYNKELFTKAGITAPPATWDEFMTAVDKLKTAGIVPYAIAGKDEWPGMHAWTYLLLRIGGSQALTQMIQNKDWNTAACKAAGAEVQKLVAKSPFQPGYLNATYDKGEAADFGNGKAAMELMGQWAPSVQAANSTSKKGIAGDKLGWFPFPSVGGGTGAATDAVGGGNGIAFGKDAPPEAVDFMKFFMSKEQASVIGTDGFGLPTTVGTEGSVTDPNLKAVLDARGKAQFVQLYLDQATSPEMGKVINDATAQLFAGKGTPEEVCSTITTAAKG
jgi:raffinose/stachyose/melibiose transport system substrate-binding protein